MHFPSSFPPPSPKYLTHIFSSSFRLLQLLILLCIANDLASYFTEEIRARGNFHQLPLPHLLTYPNVHLQTFPFILVTVDKHSHSMEGHPLYLCSRLITLYLCKKIISANFLFSLTSPILHPFHKSSEKFLVFI